MCKAFDDVQEMGRIEGRAEGRAEIIERMMKKLKLTAEEVLEFLEIPMNERAELL